MAIATTNIAELAKKMNRAGVPADYGPDNSKVISRIWKEIAKGKPVTQWTVDALVAELGVPKDKANGFLKKMAERDEAGNIIGILGLTQGKAWAHKFIVNGNELRTWCAWDTLFMAQVLGMTASVISESPVSKKQVTLTVGPDKVEKYDPKGTVVSIVTLDPDKQDKRKLEELWGNLWCKIFFFASREEADSWAKGQENITILSVEDAYKLGTLAFSRLIAIR
jgi:alkylmercury lyase